MGGGAPRRAGRGAFRVVVVALATVAALLAAAPAYADLYPMPPEPDPLPEPAVDGIYPAVFPVIGDVYYSDTYGWCRDGCSRGHLGVDIMANGVKGLPVVASAAGTVTWISGECCAMAIQHDDGWRSYYIHLNNDTPGTDDGLGWGIAPDVTWGAHVEAGQLIGWVGDSGNAESAGPHLHWELWAPDHGPINPTPHADAATRLGAAGGPADEPPCPVPGEGEDPVVCDGVFVIDDAGRWHRRAVLEQGGAADSYFFGNPGDVPFVGDWDCDGEATPGLYRRSDGYVYLRNSNSEGIADIEFFFGDPGDVPLVGDFDGDGCDTVSIYRPAEGRMYIVDELGTDGGGLGTAAYDFFFGNPGDSPFVGDFDGDGVDSVGLHRESTGFVYFRNTLSSGVAESEFFYGDPGDVIVAGDWDGDRVDTVGVYRPSSGLVYLNYQNAPGAADYTVDVGTGHTMAVAG